LRGQRIELQEIENQLLHYPAIKQAKVILSDEGEDSHLVAFVVMEQKHIFSEKDTKEYLATKVPHYMVPSEFIVLDELSRNNNEKVDRKKLKEIYKNRKSFENSVAASSRKEILKKIIAEIVHYDVQDEDSLFDMGINSITIVQLIQKAKQQGIELSLNDILTNKTIRDLVQKVNGQSKTLSILVKDLLADCQIQLGIIPQRVNTSRKKILLTGASGYLGSYLLRDLIDKLSSNGATITCLVRSVDAKEKISARIASDKFDIVLGDVAIPNLGLAREGNRHLRRYCGY
jgi:aryl carrier-like protein